MYKYLDMPVINLLFYVLRKYFKSNYDLYLSQVCHTYVYNGYKKVALMMIEDIRLDIFGEFLPSLTGFNKISKLKI